MNVLKIGFNIYNKIISKKNPLFNVTVKSQQQFLKSLNPPQDDFERSYNQYCCQKQGLTFLNNFFLNFGSLFIYFYYLHIKKNEPINPTETKNGAIFISSNSNYSCIPSSLFEEFTQIEQLDIKGFYLSKYDKEFIKRISKKYRFSFFFLTKSLLKIAIYSKSIERYNPKAIIVTSEYSFTSSILTEYCTKKDIQHINIMHGEKLLYIRDSFFHFNRCYVWDQYYIDLFTKQKASSDQYIIEIPDSQKKWDDLDIQKCIDFTYYLGDEQKDLLINIKTNLSKLQRKGYKIAIRPHPVYSDIKLISKIFCNFIIEDSDIDIKTSILRTNSVVSLFSTVNRQAMINDINYIIDDISSSKRYQQMKELEYYFVNKKHLVLSSFTN